MLKETRGKPPFSLDTKTRHRSPTTSTPLPSLPRRTRDVDDDAGDDAGDDAVHHQKTPVTTHLLLLSSPMRARQGLHSSPSWPRGLACRRPSSAGSATSRSSPVPPSPARESRRRWHARSPRLVTTRPSLLHSRDQVRERHAATIHRRLASIRRRRGHRRGFLSSWFSVSTRARLMMRNVRACVLFGIGIGVSVQ